MGIIHTFYYFWLKIWNKCWNWRENVSKDGQEIFFFPEKKPFPIIFNVFSDNQLLNVFSKPTNTRRTRLVISQIYAMIMYQPVIVVVVYILNNLWYFLCFKLVIILIDYSLAVCGLQILVDDNNERVLGLIQTYDDIVSTRHGRRGRGGRRRGWGVMKNNTKKIQKNATTTMIIIVRDILRQVTNYDNNKKNINSTSYYIYSYSIPFNTWFTYLTVLSVLNEARPFVLHKKVEGADVTPRVVRVLLRLPRGGVIIIIIIMVTMVVIIRFFGRSSHQTLCAGTLGAEYDVPVFDYWWWG